MKQLLPVFFLFISIQCLAQADSTARRAKKPDSAAAARRLQKDTPNAAPLKPVVGADSAGINAADSVTARVKDSLQAVLPPPPAKPLRWEDDTVFAKLLTFPHAEAGKLLPVNEGQWRNPEGKEQLFYILAGLVCFAAVVKAAYPKYFQDIFRLFIQTSRRQKQTPEQIVQGYVPGFLFNILFFIAGGMLIALYGLKMEYIKGPVWLLTLYSAGILGMVYLFKYAIIVFAGWVFNVKEATSTYSFIIFLINRVIGLVILPLLALISFYTGDVNTVLFTIAASVVFFLLVYRYALSLTVIRKNLKVSALHFFIYLCAVELMPLLVIYKVLFTQVHSK